MASRAASLQKAAEINLPSSPDEASSSAFRSPASSLVDSPSVAKTATRDSPRSSPAKGSLSATDEVDDEVEARLMSERKIKQFEREVEELANLLEAKTQEELTAQAELLFGSRSIAAAVSDTLASASSRQAVRFHVTNQGLKLSQGCAAALELIVTSRRVLNNRGDVV